MAFIYCRHLDTQVNELTAVVIHGGRRYEKQLDPRRAAYQSNYNMFPPIVFHPRAEVDLLTRWADVHIPI